MIGNITLQELGELVQSPFVLTAFSAYTDVSRCGDVFWFVWVSEIFSLLSDRHGL